MSVITCLAVVTGLRTPNGLVRVNCLRQQGIFAPRGNDDEGAETFMKHLTARRGLFRSSGITSATIVLGLFVTGTVGLSFAAASTSALPTIPSHSLAGALKTDKVIVPVTKGTGNKVLHAFTARKTTVYVQIACSGPSGVKVSGMFNVSSCKAKPSVFGYSFSVPKAWTYHPIITSSTKTKWEIVITDGPKTP